MGSKVAECNGAYSPPSCGMAVGRDVSIAPSRLGAVRGLASRALAVRTARVPPPPAPVAVCPPSCGMAVGRDVPIAPPRHRRGARLGIPHFSHAHYSRALCTATGRCGAMGTSRPTAITPAWGAPPLPTRITPPVRPARTPWSCAVVRSRCGTARCLAANARGGFPTLPARAAALLPVAARHRGARLGIPHTLRVLHAAALSAARCAAGPRTRRDVMIAPPLHPRNSHDHGERALPGRRDGDIAPYRHYTRMGCSAITPAKFARSLPTRIMHGHGAMRRDIRPRWLTAAPYRHYTRALHPRSARR